MGMALTAQNVSIMSSVNVRRLHSGDILFSHISSEKEHLVSFRMEPVFDVREVLGIPFTKMDRITATAYYDMTHRAALCTLEISIRSEEGREYQYRYLLTGEERRMLAGKMEAYYLKTTGTELEQFCRELDSRRVPPPPKVRT